MTDELLFHPNAERMAIRCRLCQGKRVPLGAAARHAATHIAEGLAELCEAPTSRAFSRRWRLTAKGRDAVGVLT